MPPGTAICRRILPDHNLYLGDVQPRDALRRLSIFRIIREGRRHPEAVPQAFLSFVNDFSLEALPRPQPPFQRQGRPRDTQDTVVARRLETRCAAVRPAGGRADKRRPRGAARHLHAVGRFVGTLEDDCTGSEPRGRARQRVGLPVVPLPRPVGRDMRTAAAPAAERERAALERERHLPRRAAAAAAGPAAREGDERVRVPHGEVDPEVVVRVRARRLGLSRAEARLVRRDARAVVLAVRDAVAVPVVRVHAPVGARDGVRPSDEGAVAEQLKLGRDGGEGARSRE